MMEVVRTAERLQSIGSFSWTVGQSVGFIPTMGALHAGHLQLVQESHEHGDDLVVASIFVNPAQFNQASDLEKYPRTLERDLGLLEKAGVDVAFVPTVEEVYPPGFSDWVEVAGITEPLCGRTRPGHFRGVTTVLNRFFRLLKPDFVYMGLKDYQQARVTARLVLEQKLGCEIVGVPTVREQDGLAMSSRNALLSPEGRQVAPVLYQALQAANVLYLGGERDPAKLVEVALALIQPQPLMRIDYLEVVDAFHLGVPQPDRPQVMAMAVFVEQTRLIDNMMLGPIPERPQPLLLTPPRHDTMLSDRAWSPEDEAMRSRDFMLRLFRWEPD